MGCRDDPGHVVLHDQGDAVSSYADTIRQWIKDQIVIDGASGGGAPLAALDALLAENQRLEEQRDEARREWESASSDWLDYQQEKLKLEAENQRLREALERAMGLADDAPLSVNDHDLLDQIHELIGEAWAGDADG